MSFLKIASARPGHRRAGIAHPAVKVWPADAFTDDQLKQLRNDPQLTVVEVASAEEATAAASEQGQRRFVTDVIRLLMPDAAEPLIVDTSTAVLAAVERGSTAAELRTVLNNLFDGYAAAAEAEREEAEVAPPAATDVPAGTDTATDDAAQTSDPAPAPQEAEAPAPETDAPRARRKAR